MSTANINVTIAQNGSIQAITTQSSSIQATITSEANVTADVLGVGPKGDPGVKGDTGDTGAPGGVNTINGQSGEVVLDPDDLDDTSTDHKFVSTTEKNTWNNKSDFDGDYSSLANTPSIPSDLDDLTEGTTNKHFTSTEKNKLSGIATGATANDTDANLKNRANHTGEQAISTITGLQTALDGKQSALTGLTATVTELNYTDGVTSSIQTQLDGKSSTSHNHNLNDLTEKSYNSLTDKPTIPVASDDAYDATSWNGNTDVPTKNAVRDKIESLSLGGGAVDSVNGQTGVVVLDPDDLDDTSTTNKFITQTELDKLSGIEENADVTDATNVAAAGAVMESDTSTASMGFVVDEDDMVSDSATKVPTQQSVKAYIDAQVIGGGSYTDEQAQDAVGTILTDSDEIDFTYNDATPSISAVIKASSIDETKLDASVNASLDLADTSLQSADIADFETSTELDARDTANRNTDNHTSGSTNKVFTATEQSKLSGIEANADVTDAGNVGSSIHGATAKTTPVDADTVALIDSAASNVLKKLSWSNIKATLKTYFDTLYAAVTHSHTASDVSDFDTEVSNNTDVAANTAARHAAVTVSDSSEIDLTLTGQQISAAIVAGSIDETKLDASVNASLDLADSAVQDLSDLGITATASELNALDGITATVTELNYTDGVTSAIQTQIDTKLTKDGTAKITVGTTEPTSPSTGDLWVDTN